MGDGAVKLEENTLTALNAGEAVVMYGLGLPLYHALMRAPLVRSVAAEARGGRA